MTLPHQSTGRHHYGGYGQVLPPNEDLSCLSMRRRGGPGDPPTITKKKTTKCQEASAKAGKLQPAKHKLTTKAFDQGQYVEMRAFVVHGIPFHQSIAETIQDVKMTGIQGIVGARWPLGGQRRANKTTSSVVIFLGVPVSFQAQEGQMGMKLRGRWLPTKAYNFRGRKRPTVELKSDW